jgi:hypothetical protein
MNRQDGLAEIVRIEAAFALTLPKKYVDFLVSEVGELEYIELVTEKGDNAYMFGLRSLAERNATYAIQQAAPECILIGQDGSLGYFINGMNKAECIYSLDLGALGSLEMDLEAADIFALKA